MTTPLRTQYLTLKRQYPGVILFFRLGDFYESFDEDARIVASVCDIVLTSRPVGGDERVPLAGVPYHAVDGYVAKLLNAGYKVAIAEQVGSEPPQGEKLVPRYVRRVVTPGTVVEPALLQDKANNYLAAVVFSEQMRQPTSALAVGIAYADITTGEFAATQLVDGPDASNRAIEELERLNPAELLHPATESRGVRHVIGQANETPEISSSEGPSWVRRLAGFSSTPYPVWRFSEETARQALLDHFGASSLDGYGLAGMPFAVRAAGALLQYLQETQKDSLGQLTGLRSYDTAGFMTLDLSTRRNLELVEALPGGTAKGSLLAVLDATLTPMGGRLLRQSISEDAPSSLGSPGVIRPGFSAELDGIHLATRDAKTWIANLESMERERTGIKSLKVGYNRVFGYYLEVTKANANLVPEDYIRKQTLVNAERYITPQLKEYESLVLNAEERILELEGQLYRQVSAQVAAASPRLLGTAATFGELDVSAALAEVAEARRYTRPTLTTDDAIDIRGGRHPVVERMLEGEAFAPNDALLSPAQAIVVLTGPNMSGKSTYLRQVAVIVLMAQIGSYVPADSAHIGIVDRIFTRIGASDEIARGRSTFMVEMVETANILHHATERSLLILDEIGRGTSTYDGLAIAWAVIEYVHNHPSLRAKTLFATHYHELTDLAERLPHVVNFNVAVAEQGDKVIFLHKILPGAADRSYGVHVAQLAGLPKPVVDRAQEILGELEASGAAGPRRSVTPPTLYQLPLFSRENPIVADIRALDINALSPLEALNKLYELQQRARKADSA
jgi:DNA mismatch repair ATPase MutS